MIRAAFFDLDGTLFSHRTNSVPQSAQRALRVLHDRGILTFLATGRHMSILEDLPPLQGLYYDGAITLNGGYCYDRQGVIYHNPIDPGDIAALLAHLEQHPMPCALIEDKQMYLNFQNDRVRQVHAAIHTPMPPLGDLRRGYTHPIYQALLYLTDGERDRIPPMPHTRVTKWHTGGLDVIPATGGKDVGVEKILAHYGISKEETIAFGDGDNDLDMFRAVHIAVALGNAGDRVKAASDFVTTDIDDDGIHNALTHFGLI